MRISDWSSDVCSSDLPASAAFTDDHSNHYSKVKSSKGWVSRIELRTPHKSTQVLGLLCTSACIGKETLFVQPDAPRCQVRGCCAAQLEQAPSPRGLRRQEAKRHESFICVGRITGPEPKHPTGF